jgi:hypothetical protein
MGVYHQYNPGDGRALWILLHAKPNSTIQLQVEGHIKTHDSIMQTHLAIHSAHVKSWRWYLDSLNTDFEGIVR